MDDPRTWKYDYRKKTIIDNIIDLFDDTFQYLGRSKHIKNIKNFFKRITTLKYKDKTGYIKLNKQDVFNQIKISEIQEIKVEQKQIINNKEIKKKKVITENTEPSIQQVVSALTIKTDYAKIITDGIVNIIMYILVIIVGIHEAIKFLIMRLIHFIKAVSELPFRQMFNVVFKISMVIVAIGLSIFAFNYFSSVSTAQKMSDERISKLENKIDKIDDYYNIQVEGLKQDYEQFKAQSTLVEHKITTKEYTDKFGRVHTKTKIR